MPRKPNRDLDNNQDKKKYYSFYDSVKLLVGILTALAIENALTSLAINQDSIRETSRSLFEVPVSIWLTFFTSIQFTLRFFFGNIQYLNSDTDNDVVELLIDSTTILFQSMWLAFVTNYINNEVLFFLNILVLFFSEFAWFVIFNIQANARNKPKLQTRLGLGQVNLILTTFALLLFGFNYSDAVVSNGVLDFFQKLRINEVWVFIIVAINLVVDLRLHGRRYLDIL